jgi:hypothetical protein
LADSEYIPKLLKAGKIPEKNIEHLKGEVNMEKEREVHRVVEGGATLHPDVTEDNYKPLFKLIYNEPWDEVVINFLRQLLPLLDPSLPAAEVDATVYTFFFCIVVVVDDDVSIVCNYYFFF